MTTQTITLNGQQTETAQVETQYSLAKILGIWAAVALPMALLAWVITPALIPYVNLHPGIVFWLMMIVGMAWQFVVSAVILYRFGRWDWVANAALLGLYHLHKPWMIPSIVVSSLATAWPARRFRSNWMAIIIHGVEGIFTLVIVLGVVMGLA